MLYALRIEVTGHHMLIGYHSEGQKQMHMLNPFGGFSGDAIELVLAHDEENDQWLIGEHAYYDPDWNRRHIGAELTANHLEGFMTFLRQAIRVLFEMDPEAIVDDILLQLPEQVTANSAIMIASMLEKIYDCQCQVFCSLGWLSQIPEHMGHTPCLYMDDQTTLLMDQKGNILHTTMGYQALADSILESVMSALDEAFANAKDIRSILRGRIGPMTEKYYLGQTIRFVVDIAGIPKQIVIGPERIGQVMRGYEEALVQAMGQLDGQEILVVGMPDYLQLAKGALKTVNRNTKRFSLPSVMEAGWMQDIILLDVGFMSQGSYHPLTYQEQTFMIEWDLDEPIHIRVYGILDQKLGGVTLSGTFLPSKEPKLQRMGIRIEGETLDTMKVAIRSLPL